MESKSSLFIKSFEVFIFVALYHHFFFKTKGNSGFETQLDKLWDLADLLVKEIKLRKNFEMVLEDVNDENLCQVLVNEI